MRRQRQLHAQRFICHANIGLDQCEAHGHRMYPDKDWGMALPGTRQLWECVYCHLRLVVDISLPGYQVARHGSALKFRCKGSEHAQIDKAA
jgi:hypothetical protein